MRNQLHSPGIFLLLPFVMLNAIVANRMEPVFSFIRPGMHTSPLEYVLLFVVVFLILVGAVIASSPMLRKGPHGSRRFYLVNAVVAALLLCVFAALSIAVGSEIYRCEVLQIPNCD